MQIFWKNFFIPLALYNVSIVPKNLIDKGFGFIQQTLITNEEGEKITEEWIVKTFSSRNSIEKFYREAKGWLGLKEYQMRNKEGLMRHFILVFTAYTFIIYQQLMGGLRKRYANKSLTTFAKTIEAFLTGISYNFWS